MRPERRQHEGAGARETGAGSDRHGSDALAATGHDERARIAAPASDVDASAAADAPAALDVESLAAEVRLLRAAAAATGEMGAGAEGQKS